MKIIMLTGGIGSGKSTVSSILKELGAVVIDSDRIGLEVVNKGTSGWQEIVNTFGEEILTPEGTIDRGKLARIVFRNPSALQKLDDIIHPRVDEEVERRLQKNQMENVKAVFIEMAIMVETCWMPRVNQFWVVKAPKESILERLKERGVSRSDALARMANQPPVEEKIKQNLVIIDNNGNIADLKAKIEKLWKEISGF
jgi:dephospho-CoA kinase